MGVQILIRKKISLIEGVQKLILATFRFKVSLHETQRETQDDIKQDFFLFT